MAWAREMSSERESTFLKTVWETQMRNWGRVLAQRNSSHLLRRYFYEPFCNQNHSPFYGAFQWGKENASHGQSLSRIP